MLDPRKAFGGYDLKRTKQLYAVLAISGALCGCQTNREASAHSESGAQQPRTVHVFTASKHPIERIVNVVGSLAAYDQATLSSKVSGRLQDLPVDIGTIVKQGQLVARIETIDYDVRLQAAQSAVEQARVRLGLSPQGTDDRFDPEKTGTVQQARAVLDDANLTRRRYQDLEKQGIISKAQFDSVDAAEKVALSRYQLALEEIRDRQALLAQRRSELEIARQQLINTAVYAPFDGVVQERRATIGEYLAAGVPLVTMVRVDPLRLRAEVPERESSAIRVGQTVRLTVEGDAHEYAGRVARLSPVIAEQNRMLMVEAEVSNNGSLRPGQFARVAIVVDTNSMAFTVPKDCVITFAGIEKVIVAIDGKAKERVVSTRPGPAGESWVEVVAGLQGDEQVVLKPGNLQSGQPLSVTK